jgi:hypothetical protein
MCIDCQTYACALGRPDVLDANGGTDIFQLAPAQLRLSVGVETLRCLRLGPKGALRFHAGCCNTPVGNLAPNPSVPFVGMPHAFMDHGDDPRGRARDLGPVRFFVQGQDGHGVLPPGTHAKFPPRVLLRTLRLAGRARLLGLGRPTPFWDETGRPTVTPEVLSKEDRGRFREQARAHGGASGRESA